MTEPTRRKRGRPRKVNLVPLASGVAMRMTIDRDGVTVRTQINAQTASKAVARAKARKILAGEGEAFIPEAARKGETFREAATRLFEASELKGRQTRYNQLVKYVFPEIGDMLCNDIEVHHIRECLEQASKHPDIGGWTETIRHIKNHISSVLGALYADDLIDENAALRISFKRKDGSLGGKKIRRVYLPRVVPTDEEFERFIEHGLEVGDGQLGELHSLALFARCLGGMRTSDIHAWRWDHIDIQSWREAQVPRPKTQGAEDETNESLEFVLEPYDLPESLVPHLVAWWERNGKPTEGPVFPVRRGKRAGLHKLPGATSYAAPLRDAFWAAGVVRPRPGWDPTRPQKKFCALQSGIPGKRDRLDFHSMRRASVTATSSAPELSFAESMRLADHHDPKTHMRYRRDEANRVVPESAIPRIMAPSLPKIGSAGTKKRNHNEHARTESNRRPLASEATAEEAPSNSSDKNAGARAHVVAGSAHERQKAVPITRSALELLADATSAAMREGNLPLARTLLEAAERESRAPQSAPSPTNVTRLDPARRKR
jgi:integrase